MNPALPAALAALFLLGACASAPVAPVPTDAAPQCGAQHYPFHALENDVQGDVVVRLDVDGAGRVVQAALLVPGPSRYLDSAALAGVRSCRFAPGGAPRRVDVVVAYRFLNASEFPAQGVVTIALRPGS